MRRKSPTINSTNASPPPPPSTSTGKRTPPKTTSSSLGKTTPPGKTTPSRVTSSQNLSSGTPSSSSLANTLSATTNVGLESTVSNLSQSTRHQQHHSKDSHHHHHQHHRDPHHGHHHSSTTTTSPSRRQAHFVLETIHLKKCAVLSAELGEQQLLRHDNVSNVVSLNKELGQELFSPSASVKPSQTTSSDALLSTVNSSESAEFFREESNSTPTTSSNKEHQQENSSSSSTANNNNSKKTSKSNNNAFAAEFNEVSIASDVLGASVEVRGEVERFFDTGVPLVATDQVPDADALIVVSAGPDAETNTKLTLSAVESSVKYMAYRALCVHVSACAIFGNLDEMLGKNVNAPAEDNLNKSVTGEQQGHGDREQQVLAKTIVDDLGNTVVMELPPDAKVSMFDLFEHGSGHRTYKNFAVSEPQEPYFDRYTPKHLLRLGLSNEDVDDKLAHLTILCEDQLRKQNSRALGFMFFIDCIHFRDGFQRFTSDKHVTVQSQHPASSLFFSRTTVLSTHTPALVSTLVGNLSALPPTAIHQSWVATLRHLGSETHHVLNIVASVPEENSLGYNADAHAETVLDVEELSFNSFEASNSKNRKEGSADDDLNGDEPNKNSLDTAEHIAAKKQALIHLKKAFQVSAALRAAVTAGARTPIPDHVFPKRTHMKLPEYVSTLKKNHDEHTNDQKTRHSFAKSALSYLATQVKGDDVQAVAAMGGLGSDNRERFAAIFRAAFVKNKVMKEQEKRSGSNNSKGSRSQSLNNNGNNKMNQNNSNNTNMNASTLMSPNSASANQQQFNLSHLNLASLLATVSGGASSTASPSSALDTKDINKMRQQNEALFLIKERLEFDLSKTEKDVKKLRGELSTSQTKRKRLERELTDAQGRQLVAESYVQKHQIEQDTEALELRQHILNLQQQVEALERKNNQLSKNTADQREEQERRELSMKQEYERKFRDLRTDLEVALAEKEVLQDSLEEHTGRIHAVEGILLQVDVEKKTLDQQLQDSRDAIEQAKVEAKRAIERAARMRRAEREEYLKLLEAGKSATEELVTFEDLRVDRVAANESLYRTGSDGVRKWLKTIGAEQYATVLHTAGFRDVLSVANITEQDLQALKILAGHRRKILAAVEELKGHLNVAISKRQIAPISHELANLEELIARQREWYRDFAAVVRAEQANDDDDCGDEV